MSISSENHQKENINLILNFEQFTEEEQMLQMGMICLNWLWSSYQSIAIFTQYHSKKKHYLSTENALFLQIEFKFSRSLSQNKTLTQCQHFVCRTFVDSFLRFCNSNEYFVRDTTVVIALRFSYHIKIDAIN